MDSGSGQVLQQVLFFALLVFGLYLLVIRPQRARAKALAEVRSGLEVGSRVMTTAGIHGTVVALDAGEPGTELSDTVLIEVARGVQIRFATAAVVRILGGQRGDRRVTHTQPFDADALRGRITDVPDFPSPGVVFKDISPLLADPFSLVAVVDALATSAGPVSKVVGIEARGFIPAAPVACLVGAGFVPVRKPGKLPGPTHETSYDLEYGSNVLQVHRDAFTPGERVLVVDDVLATGGTAAAAVRLVQQAGAEVVSVSVLLELGSLQGREALSAAHPGLPVQALLSY